jgi:hypothetical protein
MPISGIQKMFLLSFGLVPALAISACPELSGVYEATYEVLGQTFHLISTVTQNGCQSMKSENHITGPLGEQGYTREWIADGQFRRKSSAYIESAVFTSKGLLTTEVRSPLSGDTTPPRNYHSRQDLVSLDAQGNLVNSETRFDEHGRKVGSDRFVYQKRSAER